MKVLFLLNHLLIEEMVFTAKTVLFIININKVSKIKIVNYSLFVKILT